MPDFKFDIKVKPKKIGEFDVGNPTAWTLLIKPQIKDDTLFVHLHCHFKEIIEIPPPGSVVTDDVKTPPMIIEIVKGFIKDAKFVPTDKKAVSGKTEVELLQKYEILIQSLLNDGFMKHGEMYMSSKEPEKPVYNVFEKKAGAGSSQFDLSSMMASIGMPTPNPLTTIPKRNPILRMKVAATSSNKNP